MKLVRTTARALLGAIFVAGGARTLANPDGLVPHAKPVTDRIGPMLARIDHRLPTDTRALIRLNAANQLAGGLLLVTGHLIRPAAVTLAASLIPTTIAGHPFWKVDDPAEREAQQIHFLKNLGLLGGLILAALDTQGRPGLRWRAAHAVDHTQRSVRRAGRTARREAKIVAVTAGATRRLSR